MHRTMIARCSALCLAMLLAGSSVWAGVVTLDDTHSGWYRDDDEMLTGTIITGLYYGLVLRQHNNFG
jgi:hypothetical protein